MPIFLQIVKLHLFEKAILPMLLHVLAERIAISSELDSNAAIVLSWSGFELFCEEKPSIISTIAPKLWFRVTIIEIIIMRLGR